MRISGFAGLWWRGFRALTERISGVHRDFELLSGFRALIPGFRGEDFGLSSINRDFVFSWGGCRHFELLWGSPAFMMWAFVGTFRAFTGRISSFRGLFDFSWTGFRAFVGAFMGISSFRGTDFERFRALQGRISSVHEDCLWYGVQVKGVGAGDWGLGGLGWGGWGLGAALAWRRRKFWVVWRLGAGGWGAGLGVGQP